MEQGGFVEGRKILDGIIIAHECLHTTHFQNQASFALKLDIAKSYDNMKECLHLPVKYMMLKKK